MTYAKICGITNTDDARLAVDSGAAYLGFVMVPKSPRYVDLRLVAKIVASVPSHVQTVAVVMDLDQTALDLVIRDSGVDILQLHGDEPAGVSQRLGIEKIWKAFPLQDAADVTRALEYPAQAVLIDTAHGDQRGGTGKVGNWKLAADVARQRRTVLAGGLNAENVMAAIRTVNPWAVDVSSGVEKAPGQKDPVKLRDFMAAVRSANIT